MALERGDTQFAMVTPEGVVGNAARGGRLRLVAGNSNRAPLSLIGGKHKGIERIEDLRGKRIGTTSLKEGTAVIVQIMLAAHGLRYPADYKNDAGSKNSIELATEVKEPVLGLYGAEDAGIKVEQVNDMQSALKAAGKTAEFHIYPGAPHGFVADYRASYRKEASEDAWNQMIAWFKKYGVLS
jgi:ABC-type nitrate/sulfonate/bicarbonate transport system substrate-binding protein